jgi:phage terminase Nu1 subunit (DNA packaging protein)
MKAGQEKMEAMINSTWSESEETINNQVDGVPASADQRTHSFCKEHSNEIKKDLQREFSGEIQWI